MVAFLRGWLSSNISCVNVTSWFFCKKQIFLGWGGGRQSSQRANLLEHPTPPATKVPNDLLKGGISVYGHCGGPTWAHINKVAEEQTRSNILALLQQKYPTICRRWSKLQENIRRPSIKLFNIWRLSIKLFDRHDRILYEV